jgi:riboflavin synthase
VFTGIIETIGVIRSVTAGPFAKLAVEAGSLSRNIKLGDSVAVNGVCLTAASVAGNSFKADVSRETLDKTTLGDLQPGDEVNLETAARFGQPIGGHFVSGHIDETGYIKQIAKNAAGIMLIVGASPDLLKFCVSKGSVAIDGVSLTIAELNDECFTVAVIPFTWENTIMKRAREGDKVNLESDLFAKYIYKYTRANLETELETTNISEAFLAEHGYL